MNIIIKVDGKVVYEGPCGDIDVKTKKSFNPFGAFNTSSSVVINGQKIASGSSGDVPTLVIEGGVTGSVRSDGSVQARNIGGDVHAGGSCQCDNVTGSVNAGGSVQANDILGNARAGGSIIANRIGK